MLQGMKQYTTAYWASLITGLEYGMDYGLERWNGLWNGLWTYVQQKAPFHTVF